MNAPARFDRVALLYRWMEYLSFGPYLTQCRELRLGEAASFRSALVYGDGDGRFLAALARQAPHLHITAVDASSKMIRSAATRLPPKAQVQLVHADALTHQPNGPFDLVVSHFFLDCFNESELALLLQRVQSATTAHATWLVSDFALPEPPVARAIGRWIIGGLYLAFRVLTGLQTRRLPDHARVMRDAGWTLEDRRCLLGGLLASELWRRIS